MESGTMDGAIRGQSYKKVELPSPDSGMEKRMDLGSVKCITKQEPSQ